MRGQDRTYTHESAAAGRPGSAQGAAFWALVALVPRCTEVRALPLGGKQPVAAPYPTRVAWRDGRAPSGWVSLAAIVALWTFSSGCEDRTGPTPTRAPQQDVPAAHREQPFGRWWRWCRGVLKFGRCHWADSSPSRPPTPPVWRGVTAGHHPAGSRWPPSSHSGPVSGCEDRTGPTPTRAPQQDVPAAHREQPFGRWWRWCRGVLKFGRCHWAESSPSRPPTPPVWRGVTAGHHPAGSRWPPSSHSGPFFTMRGQDRTYTHGSAAAGRPGSAQGAAFWAVVALVPRCTEVRALPLGGKQPAAAPYPTRVAWRDGRAPSGWVSLAAIVALWTFSSGCEDRTGPTPTRAPQQDVPAAHREQPFGRWWRWCRGVLKFGRCHWAGSSPSRPPTPPVWRGVTAGHHPAGSRWPPSSHSGPFFRMRGQDRTYTHESAAAGRPGSAQGAAFWAVVALVPRCTEVRALPLGGKQPVAAPYPTRVAWRDGRAPSGWDLAGRHRRTLDLFSGCEDRTGPTPTGAPQQDVPAAHREQPFGRWWRWCRGVLKFGRCHWAGSSPPRPPTPPVWRGVTAGHHPAGSRWPPSSHSGPFLQDARTGQDLHPRERRSRTSRQRTGSSLLGGGGAGAEVY